MALVLLAAGVARADVADDAGPIPDRELRWEGGPTFETGGVTLGQRAPLAIGANLAAGARFDRLALLATCDLLALRDHQATGDEQRFALEARLSLYRDRVRSHPRGGSPHYIRNDFWIEGDVGRARVAFAGMRGWHDDVGAGLAYAVTLRGASTHATVFVGAHGTWGEDPAALIRFGVLFGD
jgi:hypothetical protein